MTKSKTKNFSTSEENSRPKVSVILSSYNHEKYIAQAIQSVLDQTFTDFELLIYDDGSTDKSREIIKTFTDPRIKTFLYEENRGPRIASREATCAATGKYLAIHHSDDLWTPEKLEKQVEFLESHSEYAACFSQADFIDEDGNLQELDDKNFYKNIFNQPNRTRAEWLNYFFYNANCLCHPSLLIRHESYAKYKMSDIQGLWQLPDYFMWIRLCFNADFYIMSEKFVKFRLSRSRENMSATTYEKRVRVETEMVFVLQSFIDSFEDDKFFLEVFPESKKFVVEGKMNRRFAFAKICLESLNVPYSAALQIVGLTLLKNLLSSTETAEEIKQLYKYDEKNFLYDTGNYDIFNLKKKFPVLHTNIYFDAGNEYVDSEMLEKYIYVEDSGNFFAKLTYHSSKKIKAVRFDPDDNFTSIKLNFFKINGKIFQPTYHNATEISGDFYRFCTCDPQFIFKLEEENFQGQVAIEIGGTVENNHLKIIDETIADIFEKNSSLEEELKKAVAMNKDLHSLNQSLINSTSWKVTAPLRKIGKIAKSFNK